MKGLYKILLITSLTIILLIGGIYYQIFTPYNSTDEPFTFYIYKGDTRDSIFQKISHLNPNKQLGIKCLWKLAQVEPQTGRYVIKPQQTGFEIVRMIRNRQQAPIRLLITPTWTIEKMASRIAAQLMIDSTEIMDCLNDSATLNFMNCTKETLPAHFIPNTYEVYWTISPRQLVEYMEREYQKFWNAERTSKANKLGLTRHEVSTLASIVCRETNFVPEMSIISGLYLNRFKRKMLLQACPTVIFARQNFSTTRLTNPTYPDSPYNTYRYLGLPPGPIFIPPIAAIDAVLNTEPHNFLYMCAKEDFSGTHNFAASYSEHQKNARKYQRAYKKRFGSQH